MKLRTKVFPISSDRLGMGLPIVKLEETGSRAPGAPVREIKINKADLGKENTLRFRILNLVAKSEYEKGIEELQEYMRIKSTFPKFASRASRYGEHSVDLIRAIKTKRRFPGFATLSKSKQQELTEVVGNHFTELTNCLKRVEAVELEIRLEDLKSTVWVVKALCYAIAGIIAMGFVLELTTGGILNTIFIVSDHFFGELLNLVGLR